MYILPSIKLPTPFGGEISLPALGPPPLEVPKILDERGVKAIGHGLGEDAAQLIGLIPWIGDIAADILEDLHKAEIKKILTPDEYDRFLQYDKVMPTTVALARIFCFEKI